MNHLQKSNDVASTHFMHANLKASCKKSIITENNGLQN